MSLGLVQEEELITVKGKVVDEKGKPVADALVSESFPTQSSQGGIVEASNFHCFTDKKGEFSFSTVKMNAQLAVSKEGFATAILDNYYDNDNLVITIKEGHSESNSGKLMIKKRNLMRIVIKKDGKTIHVTNGVINKNVNMNKLNVLAKQFIANPKDDNRLPSIEEFEIEGYKNVNTTVRHVIEIEREEGASIANRDAAYGIIANAYYELRDEWCKAVFGKKYDECSEDQQYYSRQMYAMKILIPEVKYYCDLNIKINSNDMIVYMNRIDLLTGSRTTLQQDAEKHIKDTKELDDYIHYVTTDVKSRIRSAILITNPDVSQKILDDVKNTLRNHNIISVKNMIASNTDANDENMMVVDEQPEFPGGTVALLNYLRKTIKYPAECKQDSIQGRVLVSFIVDKEGFIKDAEIVRSVHQLLDAEALRVVSAMPQWIPGKNKGEAVNVKYTVPINFRLGRTNITEEWIVISATENTGIVPDPNPGGLKYAVVRANGTPGEDVITAPDKIESDIKELFDGNKESVIIRSSEDNYQKVKLVLSQYSDKHIIYLD